MVPGVFRRDVTSAGGPAGRRSEQQWLAGWLLAERLVDRVAHTGLDSVVDPGAVAGDVVVHHARTIHGAHANASATRRRRTISVRYAGTGTVFAPVPGVPAKEHHAGAVPGAALDDDRFPRAWPPPN